MSLKYKERIPLTQENRGSVLDTLGITTPEYLKVVDGLVAEAGGATISFYQFCYAPSGPSGDLLVVHDLGKAAINFAGDIRWGDWDESYEILTLENGERFNFDGKPVDAGDEGSCSLGNV
jgi:hypothetical protein